MMHLQRCWMRTNKDLMDVYDIYIHYMYVLVDNRLYWCKMLLIIGTCSLSAQDTSKILGNKSLAYPCSV